MRLYRNVGTCGTFHNVYSEDLITNGGINPKAWKEDTRELSLVRANSPESQIGRFRYGRNGPRRKWRKNPNHFGPKTWWRSCPPYFRNNGGDAVMTLQPYPGCRWCPRNLKTKKIVRLGLDFLGTMEVSGTKNKHLFEEVLSRHKKWLRQFFAILPLSISFCTMSSIIAKSLFLSAL